MNKQNIYVSNPPNLQHAAGAINVELASWPKGCGVRRGVAEILVAFLPHCMQSAGNKHQPIMQTRLCPTRSKNSYGYQKDNSGTECEVDARKAGHSHTGRNPFHGHTIAEGTALTQRVEKKLKTNKTR